MAILHPVKLVIDNYPEGQVEYLDRCRTIWRTRRLEASEVPFGKELYIEAEDFMEEPPKKYFRLFPGNEVRLMNAYFVTCTGCEKDENGNITVDPLPLTIPRPRAEAHRTGRKVKGTIHWVTASYRHQG